MMDKEYKMRIKPDVLDEASEKMLQILLLQDLRSHGVIDDALFDGAVAEIVNIKPIKHEVNVAEESAEGPFAMWVRDGHTGKVLCSECGYEPPVNQWGNYITSNHCPGCGMAVRMPEGFSSYLRSRKSSLDLSFLR